MVPKLGQRLLIAGSILLGGLAWWWIYPWLLAGDANGGISLFQAHIGFIPAVLLIIVAGIPSMLLGMLLAGTGNPLSGIFTVGISLLFLAGAGGGIQGVIWRSQLPGEFGWLMFEAIFWTAGVIGVICLISAAGAQLRTRLPKGWRDQNLDEETRLGLPGSESLIAGLVAAAVGGLLVSVLMRAPSEGQAIGSVLLSFTAAGLLAEMIVPQANPVAVLVSPMLVAILGYAYVWLRYPSAEAVLEAYYARSLPGFAMVLPIFYASAGVAGAALGVGVAQVIEDAREPMGG